MIKKRELQDLFIALKKTIGDEYRADDEIDIPSMSVTIACNDDCSDYTYQTGDNSYTGGAYHYPHWAVVTLCRRSNVTDLAVDVINQLNELMPEQRN